MWHVSLPTLSLLVPPPDVRPSAGKGLGAFSSVNVEAGVLVGSYVGEVLTQEDIERRYGQAATPDYLFESRPPSAGGGDGLYIDAQHTNHWSRFLNHCEDGNLVPAADGMGSIVFYAAREIKADEELSFDYGLDYWASRDCHPRDDSRTRALHARRLAAKLGRLSPQLLVLSSTLLLPVLVPLLSTQH